MNILGWPGPPHLGALRAGRQGDHKMGAADLARYATKKSALSSSPSSSSPSATALDKRQLPLLYSSATGGR